MDSEKINSPQSAIPIQPQDLVPPPIPQPHSSKKLLVLGFVAVIGLLALLAGAYTFGLQKVTIAPPTAQLAPVKTQISPTTDPTASWSSYTISTVGLSFKLSPTLSSLGKWSETKEEGDTGSVLCFHIPPKTTGFIPKAYAGGAGICSSSDSVPFTIGGSSTNFSAGRGGAFTDYQGFEEQNGKYYALFVKGSAKNQIPSHLVVPVENPNGVEILKVKGENIDNPESSFPQPGSPGGGNIGAHINTKSATYPGIAVFLKLNQGLSEKEFDQILSTFKFTKANEVAKDQVEGLVRKKVIELNLVKDFRIIIDDESDTTWFTSVIDNTKPDSNNLIGWFLVNKATGKVDQGTP